MATNYEERLKISIQGDDHTRFFTESGLHVATGYERVVIGGRGPYVEFAPAQVVEENLFMPEECKQRIAPNSRGRFYYHEYRSNDESCVKVYFQRRTVDYADYKVDFFYISPFDLIVDGEPVITELRPRKKVKPTSDQLTLMDYLPDKA
jgi:hypothetical protein